MLPSILFLAALIGEVLSLMVLVKAGSHSLLVLFAYNGISSFLIGLLVWRQLPNDYYSRSTTLVACITTFCFFLPLVGSLTVFIFAIGLWILRHHKLQREVLVVNMPTHFSKLNLSDQFGIGGAADCLLTTHFSIQKRTQALLTLSAMISPETNNLVRKTLSDNNDQVRLLAFSFLDQQEKRFSKKISSLLSDFEKSSNNKQRSRIALCLAVQYWEMVYNELVQGDVRCKIIEIALNYAKLASEFMPQDPKLTILLSKLYMAKGDFVAAKDALCLARQHRAKATQVFPYLASIAFLDKNFSEVRRLLSLDPNLIDVPKLNLVIKFWNCV